MGAVFLALVYLLISFQWVIPLAAFVLNQKYIEDNLCENIQVVELDCQGKCYLSEKIIEPLDQKQEQGPISLPQLENFEYPVHTVVEAHFCLYQNSSEFKSSLFSLLSEWSQSPPTPPPRFV